MFDLQPAGAGVETQTFTSSEDAAFSSEASLSNGGAVATSTAAGSVVGAPNPFVGGPGTQFVSITPEAEFTSYDLGPGDDTLTFEGATNTDLAIEGGEGFDTLNYGAEGLTVFIQGEGVFVFTGDGVDTFTARGFERLVVSRADAVVRGSEGADNVRTDLVADEVDAGGGDDIAATGQGNDVLRGGAGNDLLGPGNGMDLVEGGVGRDTLTYAGQTEPDATGIDVNLAQGTARDLGGDVDSLISIENVRGSNLNDTIRGSRWANNLSGGAGNDDLRGNLGDDTLSGQAGADQVLGGAGDDTLFGGAGDDTVRGGAGNDRLSGGAGFDILSGGAGADVFAVGPASRGGLDVITDFEDGLDLLDVSALDIGVGDQLTLRSTAERGGGVAVLDDQGLEVVLIDADIDDIDASDFIFAER